MNTILLSQNYEPVGTNLHLFRIDPVRRKIISVFIRAISRGCINMKGVIVLLFVSNLPECCNFHLCL